MVILPNIIKKRDSLSRVLRIFFLLVFLASTVEPRSLILIAHRGNIESLPENSLSAFKKAIQYTKYLEMDIRFTKDDFPIVFHDRTLDRMSRCSGLVSTKKLQEIHKCSLDNGYKGHKFIYPPLLKDVLRTRSLENANMIIEIKEFNRKGIDQLMHVIGRRNNTTISSFNSKILNYIDKHYHFKQLYLVSCDVPLKIPNFVSGLIVGSSSVTASIRKKIGYRLKIFLWTVDRKNEFERCIKLPIDGIITNMVEYFYLHN